MKLLSQELHSTASKVRHELNKNFNKKDLEWVELYDAFLQLLDKHHIDPDSESLEKMRFESTELKKIFDKIRELNRKNTVLCEKFGGDTKFAVLYKNQQPTGRVSDNLPLYNLLNDAKSRIDQRLSSNKSMLSAQGYFRRAVGEDVYEIYDENGYTVSPGLINKLIQNTADEYINEYRGE
jgi:type I restriction enzyme R subunit